MMRFTCRATFLQQYSRRILSSGIESYHLNSIHVFVVRRNFGVHREWVGLS